MTNSKDVLERLEIGKCTDEGLLTSEPLKHAQKQCSNYNGSYSSNALNGFATLRLQCKDTDAPKPHLPWVSIALIWFQSRDLGPMKFNSIKTFGI